LNEDADIQAQERVGNVLNDKWMLERLLGVGGMAAVYAARHRNGARAAVKVLHRELARHAEVRERFLREGYAANRVEHPGVVKVLDDEFVANGQDEGTAYLVMELLEGESLQDRLERGLAVGEREFLSIAECVLEVLEAAHARGVVHRDLKPENLFLLGESADPASKARLKVLDFGLARLLQGQAITTYGLALGTPSFMSPEQAAGRLDEIDGRTDLFALGATGFRIRTGRRVHEGANAVELVTKMANKPAPSIRTVAADVSEPFARVIDRSLQFRRDDRYRDAASMREDVRAAISQLDGGETATRLVVQEPPAAAPAREITMEISERDLQHSPALPLVTRAPARDSKARPRTEPQQDWPEDSIKIPRNRSVLPWLVLLVAAGIGGKLWFGGLRLSPAGLWPRTPSPTAAAPIMDDASAGLGARDSGPDVASLAQHSASASSSLAHPTTTPLSPSSSAAHGLPPPPPNLGSAHKLPTTHHPHPGHSAQ
jgi:serine/threonine protein kinase